MELKRRFDVRIALVCLYVVCFVVYAVIGFRPAEATNYDVSGQLEISSIGLVSDVTELQIENNKLNTPDTIVGSYSRNDTKTLLIGHSTTVFQNLNQVELNDIITLDEKEYRVIHIDVLPKSHIDMNEILSASEANTLMIMTCAGELLSGGDATHRLIITATENKDL